MIAQDQSNSGIKTTIMPYAPPTVTLKLNDVIMPIAQVIPVCDPDRLELSVDFSAMRAGDICTISLPGLFDRLRQDVIETENSGILEYAGLSLAYQNDTRKQQLLLTFYQGTDKSRFILTGSLDLKNTAPGIHDSILLNDNITIDIITRESSPAFGSLELFVMSQANIVMDAGRFQFTLYETGADYLITPGNSGRETVSNLSAGRISDVPFHELYYNLSDQPRSYYVIKSTGGSGGGWSCDTNEFHVEVTVTKQANGSLTAEITKITDTAGTTSLTTADIAFTNTYTALGHLELSARKCSNMEMAAGQFNFTLYETGPDYRIGPDNHGIDTAGNITAGKTSPISFRQLNYAGIGNSRKYYVLKESSTGNHNWTCDTKEYYLEVSLADNGTGTLLTSVTGITDSLGTAGLTGSDIIFNNIYTPSAAPRQPEGTAKPELSGASDSSGTPDICETSASAIAPEYLVPSVHSRPSGLPGTPVPPARCSCRSCPQRHQCPHCYQCQVCCHGQRCSQRVKPRRNGLFNLFRW